MRVALQGLLPAQGPVRAPTRLEIALALAGNLVPLLGVLFLGWDLGLILLLYWAETGIIGALAILRIALTQGWAALFLVPFFCVHFGMFMAIHLVFLILFFLQGPAFGSFDVSGAVARVGAAAPALLGLAIAHGHAAWVQRHDKPAGMFGLPYGRIVVMQVAIILGGQALLLLGTPLVGLVVFVVAKAIAETGLLLRRKMTSASQADGIAG